MSLFLVVVVAGVTADAAYLWSRTRTLAAALTRAESDRAAKAAIDDEPARSDPDGRAVATA